MRNIKQMIYLESIPRKNQQEMEETGWEMLRNQVRCNFPITVALTQREALEYKLDLIFYSPDT